MELQIKLLDLIADRYPTRTDCVDALCQILHCSRDSIYRRMRGDTVLSPDEIATLTRRYAVSLDALIYGESDNVVCNFNAFSRKITDFERYLQHYVTDLETMRRLPGVRIYFASAEAPVFSYMYFPEVIGFKLYAWGRTTWNLDYLRNRPFDLDLLTPPVVRLIRDIRDSYNAVDTTELWSLGNVDNTLSQIEYHAQAGGFRDPADALLLCDKLLAWANHMKSVAAAGRKFNPGSQPLDSSGGVLDLYHNEMVYTNNTFLSISEAANAVYTTLANPNFLRSTDPKLCAYMEEWFESLISKSTLMTHTAEKSRDWFFQRLVKKIEAARRRVEVHLEEQ